MEMTYKLKYEIRQTRACLHHSISPSFLLYLLLISTCLKLSTHLFLAPHNNRLQPLIKQTLSEIYIFKPLIQMTFFGQIFGRLKCLI